MKKMNMFASCLAALCLTAAASALVPCDKQSECSSAKAKTVAQVQNSDSCAIGEAARAYVAQVTELMTEVETDMCPGGASVMALMAVLGENDEYKPMVAAFEQFMAEQMQKSQANAQINATSDCATKCSGAAKPVAQINASDCATKCSGAAKPVAQINASDCATKCSGAAKPVAQINASDCATKCSGAAKPVAQVNASDCASKCSGSKTVAQVTTETGCSSATKAVAQVTGESQCSKAAQARYTAYGCTNCDQIARVAARSYMNILIELKKVAGVEGCPMDVANKTLAAVMADLQTEMAAAEADNAEVVAVNLGAVSEKASGCCASKK